MDNPQQRFAVPRLSYSSDGILVTEVNGAAVDFDGLRDTFSVPPAQNGKPGEAKLIIPFTNPEIVGRFVFHCHVVKHEDKGMMMTVEVVR
jgi:suppressor of ftsI